MSRLDFAEVTVCFPTWDEWLVGPNLVFNPVDHQLQSRDGYLGNWLLEVSANRRDHSVDIIVLHVGELLPGLKELSPIELGRDHSAKAKGMLHPGDHIRLGVSLTGTGEAYWWRSCHGQRASGLAFWAMVHAVESAVRHLVCAVEFGSDKLRKYAYVDRVVVMAVAGEVTQLSPTPIRWRLNSN